MRLIVAAETLAANETQTWTDLAIGLDDRLTGRAAEIADEFEDFELLVSRSISPEASHARWRFRRVIKIRTRDAAGA